MGLISPLVQVHIRNGEISTTLAGCILPTLSTGSLGLLVLSFPLYFLYSFSTIFFSFVETRSPQVAQADLCLNAKASAITPAIFLMYIVMF